MKYLRKLTTEAEYNALDIDATKSYVVLVAENGAIHYLKGVPAGVFVQHIDGTLYTKDEWSSAGFANSAANGVAVVDSKASFVISKDDVSFSCGWSSDTSTEIQGILSATNSAAASGDYAGKANTDEIVKSDVSGAAYLCANAAFPNGRQGYLPSLGEWLIAYKNKEDIDSIMSLIGGYAISTLAAYWTSTQYGAYSAWSLNWKNSYVTYNTKGAQNYARPFCTI